MRRYLVRLSVTWMNLHVQAQTLHVNPIGEMLHKFNGKVVTTYEH